MNVLHLGQDDDMDPDVGSWLLTPSEDRDPPATWSRRLALGLSRLLERAADALSRWAWR